MPVWRKEHELARVVVHFIGIILTSVSGSALCGHLSRQAYLYQWGYTGAMALPTATCMLLAGVGFFLVSRGEEPDAGNSAG